MSLIDQGEPIIFEAVFYDKPPDEGGVPVDPETPVTLIVRRPDGTLEQNLAATRVSAGHFRTEYPTKDRPAGKYNGMFIAADDSREQVEALVIADKTQN